LPTKPLTNVQIDKAKSMCQAEGYFADIDGDVTGAGWVIGVESIALFQAATQGIKTSLIPTGVGTDLYKAMFPKNGSVLDL